MSFFTRSGLPASRSLCSSDTYTGGRARVGVAAAGPRRFQGRRVASAPPWEPRGRWTHVTGHDWHQRLTNRYPPDLSMTYSPPLKRDMVGVLRAESGE
jgi:hypothetical protein